MKQVRLSYLRFANIVAHAQREVLREFDDPRLRDVPVIAYSIDASIIDSEAGTVAYPPWGEFYFPDGPIILWQYAFEEQPDQENYYRQIKDVLRHEFRHAQGEKHGHEDKQIYATVRRV